MKTYRGALVTFVVFLWLAAVESVRARAMIDYIIDDTTNRVVSGDTTKAESFTELWKFIRVGSTWVLDEIDQNVSLSDLKGFVAKTEGAAI